MKWTMDLIDRLFDGGIEPSKPDKLAHEGSVMADIILQDLFYPFTYPSEDSRDSVMSKLQHLLGVIRDNTCDDPYEHKDYKFVAYCIIKIHDGYGLSTQCVQYLNVIHKRHTTST